MNRHLTNLLKKFSVDIIILLVIFIASLSLLFAVADLVFDDKDLAFDDRVFSYFDGQVTETATRFMQFITFFGSHKFLLPANLVLAFIFLLLKKRDYSIKIIAISLTSAAVMFLLKSILQRQRPLVPLISKVHGYSFPSGHTFSSVVFFGMLAYLAYVHIRNVYLKWSMMIFFAAVALLIGISRIYLKLHYATDVIAGLCLGLIWLILARWLLVKAEQKIDSMPSNI